jgi:hypothetical protein
MIDCEWPHIAGSKLTFIQESLVKCVTLLRHNVHILAVLDQRILPRWKIMIRHEQGKQWQTKMTSVGTSLVSNPALKGARPKSVRYLSLLRQYLELRVHHLHAWYGHVFVAKVTFSADKLLANEVFSNTRMRHERLGN